MLLSTFHRWPRFSCFSVALLSLCSHGFPQDSSEKPVLTGTGLYSLHGTHTASGIEYLRLLLITEAAATARASENPLTAPTLTFECTSLHNKRTLSLYVNFGGVEDTGFPPPFVPTQQDLFPPRNPNVAITLLFEGYIKSKPFKRTWEALPNGNYKYRNPGMGSSNLDDPRFFLQYLNSLPTLHVVLAKPEAGKPAELFFHTAPLLQQTFQAPLCQP